jgi:hypothetical protein
MKRHVRFYETPQEDVLAPGDALSPQKIFFNVDFLNFFHFNGPLRPAGSQPGFRIH